MDRRVAVVAFLVVTAVVGVAAPAAGGIAQETTETPNETAAPTPSPSGGNGSFGAAISSFMQTSAAETEGSVDNGMWVAEFARSDAAERPEMVTARTGTLERRLERLRTERAELLNESDGNVTVRERAKASRLAARIDALEDAINRTSDAARETGVNTTRLETLRTQARNLTGPEVAALARNLTGDRGPPGMAEPPGNGGPPEDAGPPGDTDDANETDDPDTDDGSDDGGAESGTGTGASDGEDGDAGNGQGPGDGGPPGDDDEDDGRESAGG